MASFNGESLTEIKISQAAIAAWLRLKQYQFENLSAEVKLIKVGEVLIVLQHIRLELSCNSPVGGEGALVAFFNQPWFFFKSAQQ